MSASNAIIRETRFMLRDRAVVVWISVMCLLSLLAVWSGFEEVQHQKASIERLIEADQQDRLTEIAKVKDWGSAAYYSFHLTYDPPSKFAFAAMGQRDSQAWKHRIRMLALEGQIYESDTSNPVIALVGRFDFAFLVAFIMPLILIVLLHDLRSGEKASGRHNLLTATAGHTFSIWLVRASVRASAVFVSLIVPLLFVGLISGTASSTLLLACLGVLTYTLFWTLLSFRLAAWRQSGSVILVSLVGIWLALAVILPAGARWTIDKVVRIPHGADILMLQRETVNDAWDLPRDVTMNAFFERYPEWSDYSPIEAGFEWQWYYAFQQVGDQTAEPLSMAYRDGRMRRDRIAAWVSLLAPPALLERFFQTLAKTDLTATMDYEKKIRAFHADLKTFYYPNFFTNTPFDKSALKDLPQFNIK